MQSDVLSLWEIYSLLEIKNKSFSRIRLNDIRERMQKQNQKYKLTLFTQEKREDQTRKEPWMKTFLLFPLLI